MEGNMADLPKSTVGSMNQELSSAGDGLVGNDDVLRGVLAGCGDCIKILDLNGRLQFMSEGGKRVMEVEDFAKLKGCPWPDFWAGIGNAEARRAIEIARAGGTHRFKGAADTAKGTPRHWDVQVSPIFGDSGEPIHLLSISRDITDEWKANAGLKEALDRQALLSGELQHRIKNTLTMVGAIANQTMRGSDVDTARQAFSARLNTLAHAHDILTQTSWASAPIKAVVDGALAPHRSGQGRFSLVGPEIDLPPRQALALSLAVHELATNALKYGALSSGGKVSVTWSKQMVGPEAKFNFKWTEEGGPEVVEPEPSRMSFGSKLIERMLTSDFRGKVTTTYRPEGIECELVAPLEVLQEDQHKTI